MSHQDIIWIVVTATFASTFGVYVGIKLIKQWTRPPMNVLTRHSRDVELVDYIEPTQPSQVFYPRELLDSQFIERISLVPSYDTGPIPSYQSGIIPSYHTEDRFNIHLSPFGIKPNSSFHKKDVLIVKLK